MMRVVETLIAVAILAAGITGLALYLPTQTVQLHPLDSPTQSYDIINSLYTQGTLFCSPASKAGVEEALYVLLPPSAHYTLTVYVLSNGVPTVVYSVSNQGVSRSEFVTSVTVALSPAPEALSPADGYHAGAPCFAVFDLGEGG